MRAGLEGDRKPSTRPTGASVLAGLTRREGSRGPSGRALEPSGERACSGPRVWAGQESEAWEEKALERQKPRRGSAAGPGQLVSARTDSQEDQGFEAGEAGGTRRPPPPGPRVTGKRVFGRVKREPIVVGGIRQLRASVGVEETDDERTGRRRLCTPVDNRKGASGLERGARFL